MQLLRRPSRAAQQFRLPAHNCFVCQGSAEVHSTILRQPGHDSESKVLVPVVNSRRLGVRVRRRRTAAVAAAL